jgi:hypothetical protein
MKNTATKIRCVPRYGYDCTEVRTIDLDAVSDPGEQQLLGLLKFWFAARGIADAVYGVDVDDYGYFAIINDEAYEQPWGTPLL